VFLRDAFDNLAVRIGITIAGATIAIGHNLSWWQ
jgi:hypothetical protein